MNPFKKLKAYLRYREAVRKADEAHVQTGERYYVIPASGKNKTLLIMNRTNFRKLKQKNYITRKAFVRDLEKECFYCTPYRNGTGKLSNMDIAVRKSIYYNWYNGKIQRQKQAKS